LPSGIINSVMSKLLITTCLILGIAASVATFAAFDMGDLFSQPYLFVLPIVASLAIVTLSVVAWIKQS